MEIECALKLIFEMVPMKVNHKVFERPLQYETKVYHGYTNKKYSLTQLNPKGKESS